MEPITLLEDKRILLGVTGSIACYKAVDLASKLTQAGALVDVIMTESAQRFVAPLTFQAVTGRPVYTNMWRTESADGLGTHIAHVGLGEEADLMLVVPATAHTLARLAHGFADDLLALTALAVNCPLMVAPAMDGGMYIHSTVQANLDVLKAHGVMVIPPETGRFASGMIGQGRLPETPTLLGYVRLLLAREQPETEVSLLGQKVVVSAGGTREPIDPVRYVTNRSSGKQGYALAQAALDAGAREVVLVSTAENLPVPIGAEIVIVDTAESMLEAILEHCVDADLLVMAAAVADFKPETIAHQKIKKDGSDGGMVLTLIRTPDILVEVKVRRENTGYPRLVVGFAAESENLLVNARSKLERKGLDLLVANDITAPDSGFQVDTNRVIVLDSEGDEHPFDLASKTAISEMIIARAASLLKN
jgi:phosphopantothenoylcysteine decarboxylase / phosphopantothenate---cysteine ligase